MTQNNPNNNVIYPANVARLRKAWIYRTGHAIESSPAIAAGVIYAGSSDQHVYALEARTGKQFWSYRTEGAIYATPTVVDDVVYVGSFDATLSALEARTGSLLDRKSTRLNSSHGYISYAVFCLKKKNKPSASDSRIGFINL